MFNDNIHPWRIDKILSSDLFYEAMSELFDSKSASYIKKEREQARQLKKTRWWKEKLQQGLCHHCGQIFPPEELTMDHLVPLARGGRTGKNNVVVSCRPCNIKKSYKTLVGIKLKSR